MDECLEHVAYIEGLAFVEGVVREVDVHVLDLDGERQRSEHGLEVLDGVGVADEALVEVERGAVEAHQLAHVELDPLVTIVEAFDVQPRVALGEPCLPRA